MMRPGAGAHLSANETIARIWQLYYWLGMGKEVKLWFRACHVWRRKKAPPEQERAQLTLHNVGVPWDSVAPNPRGPLHHAVRHRHPASCTPTAAPTSCRTCSGP